MINTTSFQSSAGKVNVVRYTPDTPVSDKLLTVVQFPGNGEVGSDPNKAYSLGPLYFVKNKGFAPNDMQFIFIQTPYTNGGTFGNVLAPGFIKDTMNYIRTLSNVDMNKIFLTGLSYGADHLLYWVQKTADADYLPVAGIIPMSMGMNGSGGNYPNDYLSGNDKRFNKMTIWAFCGTADNFFSAMQHFSGLQPTGVDPTKPVSATNPVAIKVTEKFSPRPGAHDSWNSQYDNTGALVYDPAAPTKYTTTIKDQSIYDWMRAQVASSGNTGTTPPPVVTPPVTPPAKTVVSVVVTTKWSDGSTKTDTIV